MSEKNSCVKEVRQVGSAIVVDLTGDIDLHHTPAVHKSLIAACDRKPDRLVVNLRDVAYMDSSGIGTLVEVLRRVKGYKGAMILCSMNERVYSVFEITKLDQFFEIHNTEEEALTA